MIRSLGLLDQLPETFHFGGAEFFCIQEIEDELFGGVLEEAAEDLANGALAGLVAGNAGLIEEGASVLFVLEIAFVFEDAEDREDGGVGGGRVGRKGIENVFDGGGTTVPEDVHEPELGFGEGG